MRTAAADLELGLTIGMVAGIAAVPYLGLVWLFCHYADYSFGFEIYLSLMCSLFAGQAEPCAAAATTRDKMVIAGSVRASL